jgi:lipoprotein-anchoring transpeptidase ErfK/SrfK
MDPNFSRRDFLKVSSAGLLGALFADVLRPDRLFGGPPPGQGRITLSGINLYAEPSYLAKKLYAFRRDEVVAITSEVNGDLGYGNPYNSRWYKLNDEGYTYSGWVQPVETIHQEPVFQLPEDRMLAEVTVPFTDSRYDYATAAGRSYRLFYSTTHWVTDVVVNSKENSVWYKIYDEYVKKSFYVDAQDLRLIPPGELAPLSTDVPDEDKHIYIDLASQVLTAFEGDKPFMVARCSTGAKGSETPTGGFRTYHKGPSVHMTNQGDAVEHIYDLPGVPWVSFFTGSGVSLHGTYWHNDYGRPRSNGCVNLKPAEAKLMYLWTRPTVPYETSYLHKPGEGTRVEVVSKQA